MRIGQSKCLPFPLYLIMSGLMAFMTAKLGYNYKINLSNSIKYMPHFVMKMVVKFAPERKLVSIFSSFVFSHYLTHLVMTKQLTFSKWHFYMYFFFKENVSILNKISVKYIHWGLIGKQSALVHAMAWCQAIRWQAITFNQWGSFISLYMIWLIIHIYKIEDIYCIQQLWINYNWVSHKCIAMIYANICVYFYLWKIHLSFIFL